MANPVQRFLHLVPIEIFPGSGKQTCNPYSLALHDRGFMDFLRRSSHTLWLLKWRLCKIFDMVSGYESVTLQCRNCNECLVIADDKFLNSVWLRC